MDNQINKTICSDEKVLKLMVLTVIALQLLGFILSADYFTSIIKNVSETPQASVVPVREEIEEKPSVSVNGHTNTEYGFSFATPKSWNEIGFVVKEEGGVNGQKAVFNYYLVGQDGQGHAHFLVSSIGVYDADTYVKGQCAAEGPCVPGSEIGKNSKYVFVSENSSPEAFGSCYETTPGTLSGDFYESNKSLCEVGPSGRQTERVPGNFIVLEVK